uniref:VTT domain-containing protein n=1 Tax=Aplanochytrium stocchinoi TaxID=215587 RepID=A0A7S3PLM0_9STRA|mmetsp:Transcript_14210/g.17595  ORF Transcript_14210/g.17595 Transcript_14210/m.17595 type:complete len:340 (-) Transcript_14210:706-1725(-)|eukprot:CAMPEP_0204872148 /NCGR_PEP_ID=MMETSP1348-20121228/37449_1 /ASSEMBLY_ACC=CAM_ASM_000700 /TAXON_ID=215587 /ORGANISM="Aplanochytrium stocchinoi, Strain GSBS06" /LENGTH=339 /DNA_ID=CAMNT_0052026853 /DNA_START=83 /DNA_END=1102 /DNA_ORIENTATION=+
MNAEETVEAGQVSVPEVVEESDPVKKTDPEARRREASQSCGQTCKSFITPKSILAAIVWCGMASFFIWLIISGTLETVQGYIEDLGYAGYAIFFFMFILVAQPFGWGYQATTIACGFVYGWPGLAVCQVSTHVGAAICFFGVRYFARDFVQSRLNKLQPKLQLIVKKLEVFATKSTKTAYPFMVGARQTPITFGMTNAIFALTDVTYLRFFITTVLGTMIESPISINIGILLNQAAKTGNDDGGSGGGNSTTVDEAEAEQLQTVTTIVSAVITAIVFVATAAYSYWFVKQLTGISTDDIWEEIEKIDNGDEDAIEDVFAPVSHHESTEIVDKVEEGVSL